MKIETDRERITETDHIATAYNRKWLGESCVRRIVVLACGHRAVTRNAKSMVCPRCTEMLRRSVESGEEDYESFRHCNLLDTMVWPDDPCRLLNERTDLAGKYSHGE